jgi:hypothetical protein
MSIITDLMKISVKQAADKYKHVYDALTFNVREATVNVKKGNVNIDDLNEKILELSRQKESLLGKRT